MNTLALSGGAQNGITILIAVTISAASLALWLLPVFVAIRRHSPNVTAILWLDLLLGWTFVGWVVALVWALKPPVMYPPPYTQYGPGMPESPGRYGPGHS